VRKPRSILSGLPRTARPQAVRTGYKGRSLGSFVPKVTQPVFEKFGFATAALLSDWATIVGPDVAGYAVPERLKWPHGVDARSDAEDGRRAGATLLLRVEPARALDVSYRARQLIDRINAYFGYRAVAELRFVQAPIPQPVKSAPLPARAPSATDPSGAVAAVVDEALRAALAGLGASIAAEKQQRSTA